MSIDKNGYVQNLKFSVYVLLADGPARKNERVAGRGWVAGRGAGRGQEAAAFVSVFVGARKKEKEWRGNSGVHF